MCLARCHLFIVFLLVFLGGCSYASFQETQYMMAHNPETGTTNYFRIKLVGHSTNSSVKYSMGYYDKEAVDRLFGEAQLEHEYRSTRLNFYDAKGNRSLTELNKSLSAATTARDEIRHQHGLNGLGAVNELIGIYATRLATNPNLSQLYKAPLDSARAHVQIAGQRLTKGTDIPINEIDSGILHLRRARGWMLALRSAIDGNTIVRFLDGSGNEIDVNQRREVIFVATDISKYSTALRNLTEGEQFQRDLMNIVMGDNIKDARRSTAEHERQEKWRTAAIDRLQTTMNSLNENIPADLVTTDQNTLLAGKNALNNALLDFATVLANTRIPFISADQVDMYLREVTP